MCEVSDDEQMFEVRVGLNKQVLQTATRHLCCGKHTAGLEKETSVWNSCLS